MLGIQPLDNEGALCFETVSHVMDCLDHLWYLLETLLLTLFCSVQNTPGAAGFVALFSVRLCFCFLFFLAPKSNAHGFYRFYKPPSWKHKRAKDPSQPPRASPL